MTHAVLDRDTLMPRPPGGMGPGLVLALLVHAALVVAIAFSVRWRASEPEGNPQAEVEIKVAPDGTILSQRLLKSSGLKEWDEAVQRAIDRTQVLPRDVDGRVPSTMVIAFRPRD